MIETIARSVQLAGTCATDSGIERKVAAPTQAYVYLIERVSQSPEESERESEGARVGRKEMERVRKEEGGRDENTNRGGEEGKNETEDMQCGTCERRRPKSPMRGAGAVGKGARRRG